MKTLIFVIILAAATSAFAGEGNPNSQPPSSLGDLPGGLSIDSVVKEINASIEDWKNERAQAKPDADRICAGVRFWQKIFPGIYREIPYSAVIDAESILENSFSNVVLETQERDQLNAIHAHPGNSILDTLEVQIGLRQLAMTASNRTYAAAIEELDARGGAEARCEEASVRVERDLEMIRSAQALIEDYQRYDAASTQVIIDTAAGKGGEPTVPPVIP